MWPFNKLRKNTVQIVLFRDMTTGIRRHCFGGWEYLNAMHDSNDGYWWQAAHCVRNYARFKTYEEAIDAYRKTLTVKNDIVLTLNINSSVPSAWRLGLLKDPTL